MNNLTASQADYLKAIYLISLKEKITVTKIANYLNYSKPSVIRALKSLRTLELIVYSHRVIKMTSEGKKRAKDIIRRDNVLRKFMIDILGIDEEIAIIDSENMKHAISCYTITKLEEYVKEILEIHNEITEINDCLYDCNSEMCEICGRFMEN